ncbi:MAG: DUF2961 domain-containing protein [Candidatus Beckwithbacteria bacterium]|nr:DUF2961 domain-containing protein [Patescibacteria group bacterium]
MKMKKYFPFFVLFLLLFSIFVTVQRTNNSNSFDFRSLADSSEVIGISNKGRSPVDFIDPVYLPIIKTDWQWHMESGWDKTGGNKDDGNDLQQENGKWVLLNKSGSAGVINRIWFAQPVPWLSGNIKVPKIEIQIDTKPSFNLDFNDLAGGINEKFIYPLIAGANQSSGGLISYIPIVFNKNIKILSDLHPKYFQISYSLSSTNFSNIGIQDIREYEYNNTWTVNKVGKTVDNWSARNKHVFGSQMSETGKVTLKTEEEKRIFSKNNYGTITRISFPASEFNEAINNLWLRVDYGDSVKASVELPLRMVFQSLDDNFVLSYPPVNGLDAHVFAPTGKEIVIKDDTVWIREPYLESWDQLGLNNSWYRMKLSTYFTGKGDIPPSNAIDSYAILPSGLEIVIKDSTYWHRNLISDAWIKQSLTKIWNKSSTNGFLLPTNNIDVLSYSLEGNETIISGDRYWYRAAGSDSYWSGLLKSAWGLNLLKVDGHTFVKNNETIISGDRYWYRKNSNSNWTSGLLSSAWGKDDKSYTGSIFFGYDENTKEYYITWPIPYWKGVKVYLKNKGNKTISNIPFSVKWTKVRYKKEESGYLNISYTQDKEKNINGKPNIFTASNIHGKGKFVGMILMASGDLNPKFNRTFLEGDEIVTVDGKIVGHGTGIEDFFNSGWYFIHGPFYLPTHGVIKSPPGRLWKPLINSPKLGVINMVHRSTTHMYRHFLNDAIEFNNSFLLSFEFGGVPGERLNKGYNTEFEALGISYLNIFQ